MRGRSVRVPVLLRGDLVQHAVLMRLNGEQDQKQQKQRAGKPERDRRGELPAQQLQRQTDQQEDPDPLEHDRPRLQHIKAYEECASLGLNVAATVSFTVPQVLAVGEAAARGKERAKQNGIKPGLTIAVLMCGRLDDYLRDVAHDSGAAVSESDITQAGIACLKKAYRIFNERGYDTYLMPAGCRGANQIIELAGAKMIFSIAPKIVKMLPSDTKCEERIDVPVAQDVIDRLMTMPEFRKAYLEDGMTREQFITFGSANRTTDQFINDGWNPLINFKF